MIADVELERELGLLSIEAEARGRYQESESDHTAMVARYRRFHHFMYPPQYGEGSGDQWPEHARQNPDKIHVTENVIRPFVTVDARLQAIAPRVTIPTAKLPVDVRDRAEAVETLVMTWLEDSGWDVWRGRLCLVRSLYGKGVLKPFWDARAKQPDVYVLEQPQNLRVGWGRSDFTVMDWALYEMTMSPAEARRRYKGIDLVPSDTDPSVLNVIRLYDSSDLTRSAALIGPPYRQQTEYEQRHLMHWDYWWVEDGTVWNAILLNGTVVEGPKAHREMPTIPYIVIENDHEPGSPDGVSTAEPLLDMQLELNRLMSHAFQHVMDNVDPAWQATGEEGLSIEPNMVPKSGEILPVGNAQILPIQTSTNTVPFMDLAREAWNALHRMSGEPEILFGQAPADISGRATAIQIQSAVNRIDFRRQNLYEGYRSLIRFWLHLATKVDPQLDMLDGTKGSLAQMVQGFDRWQILPPELTPRDIAEVAQVQQGLVASGLSSALTAMDQIGIEAPEAEQDLIREERSDIVLRPDAVQQTVAVYPIMLQVQQQLAQLQQQVTDIAQGQQQGGMSPTAQGQRTQNVGQQRQFSAQPSPLGEDQNQPPTTTGSPPPATGQGPDIQTLIRAGGAPGGAALNQISVG